MGLFGIKTKEEKREEDLESLKTKPIKDLNPQNARKRKEIAKPWGRNERLAVFLALFITVFLSALLSLASKNFKLPGFPRLDKPAAIVNSVIGFHPISRFPWIADGFPAGLILRQC